MELQNNKQTEQGKADNHNSTPAIAPPAVLVCTDTSLDNSLEGLVIELNETEQTIGRAEANTVVIDYMRVSRHHARIYPDNGEWVIEDISSTNGIFVSNIQTTQATLSHGIQLSIASIPFRFELKYNDTEPAEQPEPLVVPKTVRKQLNQNPEATIVMQSSPYTAEQKISAEQPSSTQYGWFVAITLIILLSSAVLSSVFA